MNTLNQERDFIVKKKFTSLKNLQTQKDVQPKSLRRGGDRGLFISSLRMNEKTRDTFIFKCIANSYCKKFSDRYYFDL